MTQSIDVLYVDDDSDVVDAVTSFLAGYDDRITVQTAAGGREGLAVLADGGVDCIVSDYDIPGLNGIEFLEAVREDERGLPFVLFTGTGSEEIASRAISANVSEYLEKSSERDTCAVLADRITELVTQQRSQPSLQSHHRQQGTTEEELEQTRDLLRKTERIADVGGWELDTETMDVFWTDNLFTLFGIDSDEAPPLEEALALYHDDDRPLVENAVEEALDSGEPFDIDARIRRPDDEIRWLHVQGMPTTEDGDVVTLRGTVHDITERRTRERVLRDMYDIISDRQQSFDEQVRELLELGRAELDIEYGTLSEIRDDEYRFDVVVADDDSVQEGDVVPVAATNCEIAASSEETVVLGNIEREAPQETDRAGFTEWGISCYLGAPVFVDDDVYGTFCFYDTEPRIGGFSVWEQTLVDLMSRWVSYELQRRQVNEQLQEKNEQLEEFASIVSHDLRNPLNVAELRLDLAKQKSGSEHLDAVEQAHERMKTLIDDILTLAHDGGAVIDGEAIEIAEITDDSWAHVDTADATLIVDSSRPMLADRSRLKQVFENLFRNAIEHGGTDATVRVGTLTDGFYVEDDGAGVPEDARERLFETGYSTAEGGTGFGLSIVEQVVDAHGWGITIGDEAEGGARFEITGIEFVGD